MNIGKCFLLGKKGEDCLVFEEFCMTNYTYEVL